jgi:hypothetical protein
MVDSMREVYRNINTRVDITTTERLNLPDLLDVEVGDCKFEQITDEQNQLFNNRNHVAANEIVVYFVRSTIKAFNGCAAHPEGKPEAIVTRSPSQWTLAHEVGHVLGLGHAETDSTCLFDRLMTGCVTDGITNPPPDTTEDERTKMEDSNLAINC